MSDAMKRIYDLGEKIDQETATPLEAIEWMERVGHGNHVYDKAVVLLKEALTRPAPNHTKDSTGGPSACKWCAHKDMTCLIPHISCDHPLFGPGDLTSNVPTEHETTPEEDKSLHDFIHSKTIKPITPAEAEALVDALTDPLRKVLRGEMDFMEAMPLIGAASRKIIAALTGGGA